MGLWGIGRESYSSQDAAYWLGCCNERDSLEPGRAFRVFEDVNPNHALPPCCKEYPGPFG